MSNASKADSIFEKGCHDQRRYEIARDIYSRWVWATEQHAEGIAKAIAEVSVRLADILVNELDRREKA